MVCLEIQECQTSFDWWILPFHRLRLANFSLSTHFVPMLIWFLSLVIGLATVVPGSGKVAIFYCVIAGIGFAFPLVLLNTVTQLAVDPSVIGLATALVISARSVGGALGIAIVGAVFNAKITIALPTFIENAIIAAGKQKKRNFSFLSRFC